MDTSRIHSAAKRTKAFSDPYQKRVIQPGHNIVRLVGPYVTVFRSWIFGKDEKTRPFNLRAILPPEVPNGPDRMWECGLLLRIIDAVVGEGTYDLVDKRGGGKRRVYRYEVEKRDCYRIVGNNDTDDPEESGWKPSEIGVLHCIPRDPTSLKWCMDNSHAMLLTKAESEIGIGGKSINSLSELTKQHGDPEEYDIDFRKTGSGRYGTDYHCELPAAGTPGVEEGLLLEWEAGCEFYDVDTLCSMPTAEEIAEHCTEHIERIDADLGTNFLGELDQLLAGEGASPSVQRTVSRARTVGTVANRQPRQARATAPAAVPPPPEEAPARKGRALRKSAETPEDPAPAQRQRRASRQQRDSSLSPKEQDAGVREPVARQARAPRVIPPPGLPEDYPEDFQEEPNPVEQAVDEINAEEAGGAVAPCPNCAATGKTTLVPMSVKQCPVCGAEFTD